jgi:hypothetical protein
MGRQFVMARLVQLEEGLARRICRAVDVHGPFFRIIQSQDLVDRRLDGLASLRALCAGIGHDRGRIEYTGGGDPQVGRLHQIVHAGREAAPRIGPVKQPSCAVLDEPTIIRV